jgi:hypothetical protein
LKAVSEPRRPATNGTESYRKKIAIMIIVLAHSPSHHLSLSLLTGCLKGLLDRNKFE